MKQKFTLFTFLIVLFTGCNVSQKGQAIIIQDKKNDKTTISIFAGLSTTDAGIEEMITRKLAEEMPNVDLEWETAEWGTTFSPLLKAKLSAGEIPDIIIGKAQDIAEYEPTGFLAPIPQSVTDCIRKEGLQSATINKKIYGAVYNALYQGVLYNKNIFWRYGLEVPHTRKEMEYTVQTLTNAGITPFASHFQENWFTANIMMQFAINELFKTDPDWGEKFKNKQYSFANSPEMKDCFSNVHYILQHSFNNAFIIPQTESDRRFIQEEAAMYMTGSWSIQAIHTIAPGMQIGIFPYPNIKGDSKLIYEPNLTFMKSAETKYPELVDKILTSLFQDRDFAKTFDEFTQTSTMLKAVPDIYPEMIYTDIQKYKKQGAIVTATVGNSQLPWPFQASMAHKIILWLQNKWTLSELLTYCDNNRTDDN